MTPEQFLIWANVLPEPLCLVTGAGRVLACNQASTDLLGLPCGVLESVSLADLTADPVEKLKHYLSLCAGSRQLCIGSLALRSKDSTINRYRCEGAVLQPRTDEQPALLLLRLKLQISAASQFTLLNKKIEELDKEVRTRRRAEDEAHAQRERFRVTLASIGDAVIATDAQGHITFMNAVAESLTGWRSQDVLGLPLPVAFRIINEATRQEVENPVAKVLQDGVIVGLANHTVLIAKDQSERPIEDSAAPIKDEDGKIIGTVLVFHDVSERRQAEVELRAALAREQDARKRAEEASQLKDEFLATVSHELRTPLNGILGWVRMLRGAQLDAGTTARALETIEKNCRAQNALIEDILDVSRIVTGRLRLNPETIDLLPLLEATLDSMRPAAQAKGVELQSTLKTDASTVFGDPQRIQQIVWNLLSNALKFTPRGGRVELSLERHESQIKIVVSDTGIGIGSDFLPYVFDRFRQADSSTTRAQGGMGLGLAIVRHLVELHGGTVAVESPGIGQGATFQVRLPIAVLQRNFTPVPAIANALSPADIDDLMVDLQGLRVLIVEDDEASREMLVVALSQNGALVDAAASVAEALQVMDRAVPEVLISDIGMPVEDGYALIRRVRERAPELGGRIPAIALTAFSRSEDRLKALGAGYQMHLAKPVDPLELIAVVGSLTGRLRGE